jgi:hypothetical protein
MRRHLVALLAACPLSRVSGRRTARDTPRGLALVDKGVVQRVEPMTNTATQTQTGRRPIVALAPGRLVVHEPCAVLPVASAGKSCVEPHVSPRSTGSERTLRRQRGERTAAAIITDVGADASRVPSI